MDLFIELEGWSTPSNSLLSESPQTLRASNGHTPIPSPAESQVQFGMASRSSSQSLKSQSGAEQNLAPGMDSSQNDRARIKKGRKGHSKSRTGCLNCKKARIKVCWIDINLLETNSPILTYVISAKRIAQNVITALIETSSVNGLICR